MNPLQMGGSTLQCDSTTQVKTLCERELSALILVEPVLRCDSPCTIEMNWFYTHILEIAESINHEKSTHGNINRSIKVIHLEGRMAARQLQPLYIIKLHIFLCHDVIELRGKITRTGYKRHYPMQGSTTCFSHSQTNSAGLFQGFFM